MRLSEINLNQMHLALQLYQARDWLRKNENNDHPAAGRLHSFRYDDPHGPYQALKEISYATETNIQQFYRQLQNPEDQTYHTINFTAHEEYYFFRSGLLNYGLLKNRKFQEMLVAYIKNKAGYFEKDVITKLFKNCDNLITI